MPNEKNIGAMNVCKLLAAVINKMKINFKNNDKELAFLEQTDNGNKKST